MAMKSQQGMANSDSKDKRGTVGKDGVNFERMCPLCGRVMLCGRGACVTISRTARDSEAGK